DALTPYEGAFLLAPRGCEHLGTACERDLDRRLSHATGGGVDQDPVAPPYRGQVGETPFRGKERERDRGCLCHGKRGGDPRQGVLWSGYEAGEGTLADPHDLVSRSKAGDTLAHAGDYAR